MPASIGTVMGVASDTDGSVRSVSAAGHRSFAGTALTEVREREGSGKKLLSAGTPVQAHSDGNIAWGRWTGGRRHTGSGDDDDEGSRQMRALHYFTFAGTPSIPVQRTFNSFGATAPTVTSLLGNLVATGSENAARGTLRVAFPSTSGGSASFSLTVPVLGQTFSLTGTAGQTGTYGFGGAALITSTGLGCVTLCTGTLGSGSAVRGLVGGTGSARAGLVYGFRSNLGLVSGAVVFKP